jgi:lysophospholipase L1-like esterase
MDGLWVHDTVTRTPKGAGDNSYVLHNMQAAARFTTIASNITLGVVSNGDGAPLGVWKDGVFLTTVAPSSTDGVLHNIAVALGTQGVSKLVEIRESVGLTDGSARDGTFLRHVAGANPSPAAPTVARRLVFYGDSIVVGYRASVQVQTSMVARVRADFPGRVTVEAYGGRSLDDDAAALGTLAALLVAAAADSGTRGIWIEIGTNDWGAAKSTAAVFGTRYAALLDAIRALDTTVAIYCQSPAPRTDQAVANGLGEVLATFRNAIVTATSTRPWSTYVDGLTMYSLSDIADNPHPNNTGHAAYKTAVKTAIGY